MLATLNIITNPFHPQLDRVQKPIRRKLKVQTLVKQNKINLSKPVICYYNGAPILRKDWERTYVKSGDVVSFIYLPQGGGGGGSNPIKLVLMVALAVYAPGLAASMGSAMGISSTIGIGLLQAGIGLLGSTLINALIPPPQPPKSQQQSQMVAPSPTYNIEAQGNQARIGQPIPVLYGKMKLYPDFAAQPYAEYESNEQYLYQLFVVSQGLAIINTNDIFIEDSPIASFGSDFEVEMVAPNQISTLYPREVFNVEEVSGQQLSPTPAGPFTVNPSLTLVNKLSFDVALPGGLSYINNNGGYETRSVTFVLTAQRINDAGANVGSSFTLGTETISAATTTAIRRTYKYDVTPGRYRVSASRTTTKSEDRRFSNDLVWGAARGYSVATRSYGDITMLAMKIKATNTISSQSSRKVNLIARRALETPVYNSGTLSYGFSTRTETRSIARAIVDMCRAEYGAKVATSRYNVAQLLALDAIWTSRGDSLNCVFDSSQTFWEALTIACRAGRARPFIQGGVIHFVRDSLQTLPTAMFTSRNIVKNTFKLTYVMPSEDNADCIDVEYFDEVIWKPRVVRAQLDQGATPVRPAKIKAFGITTREQAFREGMYAAASNRYRRKEISFETELEGHIPALGDLIGVQSDIPEWGQHGEVISATPTQLVSSEPFTWTGGATHFAMLRRKDGSAFGPIQVARGANDSTLLFVAGQPTLDFTVNTDLSFERTYISFGRSGQVIQLARVLSITPRGNTVAITAISEDARVHSADGTPTPLDVYEWSLSTPRVKPTLDDFSIRQVGSGITPSISVSWAPTPGASKYVIEKSFDNQNWEAVGEITLNNFSFLGTPGTLYVRVAAFGGVLGPYVTKSIVVGEVPPPADLSAGSISSNGQSFSVSWNSATDDADAYYVEVLSSGSVKRSFNTTTTNFTYSLENAIADGGPWRSITVRVFAKKGSVLSVNPLALNGTNAAPAAPSVIVTPGQENISITVSPTADLDYAGTLIYVGDTAGFTPAPGNLVYEGRGNFYLLTNVSGTKYIKAAHYDTYGKTGLNYSAVYSSTPTTSTGGIEVVNALPTTGNFEGRVIYLTIDDKLYTWDADTGVWKTGGGVAPGSVGFNELQSGLQFQVEIEAGEITTNHLSAGAVTANKINVANLAAINANMGSITAGNITLNAQGFIRGGQTAYSTGTGYWLGYHEGQYKFSIGNTTNGMTWDGGSLDIKGNLTAGSINLGNKFIASNDGSVSIKSATTGARLEITNDVIKVFDANSVLRVKLGNLL